MDGALFARVILVRSRNTSTGPASAGTVLTQLFQLSEGITVQAWRGNRQTGSIMGHLPARQRGARRVHPSGSRQEARRADPPSEKMYRRAAPSRGACRRTDSVQTSRITRLKKVRRAIQVVPSRNSPQRRVHYGTEAPKRSRAGGLRACIRRAPSQALPPAAGMIPDPCAVFRPLVAPVQAWCPFGRVP